MSLRPPLVSRLVVAATLLALPACAGSPGGEAPGSAAQVARLSVSGSSSVPRLRLEMPEALRERFAAPVDSVRSLLERAGDGAEAVPVRVRLDDGSESLPSEIREALARPEAFWIEIAPDSVTVVGADSLGALHGLTRLAEMVRTRGGAWPEGRVVDWPVHRTRVAHFVLRNVEVEEARRVVDIARRAHFNTLMIQLADGLDLPSMGEIPRPDAWSVETFVGFLEYARENGLRFIPELKLLTHQEKLFRGHYPELMYNGFTYDPRKEATYDRVFPIIDEVLEISGAEALHIGHDEVEGVGRGGGEHKVKPENALPADLFLQDVRRLHGYLSERGIETWMWGDMLATPSEFPGMLARHLHADRRYAALRGRLPADIVLNDWHYADRQDDFPSSAALVRAGHDVLGASWKHHNTTRAFSRYVAGLGPKARGMIATTWWHVQKDDWDVVEEIYRVSGSLFWDPAAATDEGSTASGR